MIKKHASLFSGVGGFDLAAQWAGLDNEFMCEIDAFCRKVLKYYWPKATLYDDIRKTDFSIWGGRIDVLTGGFPCQGFSLAGKRLGTDDDRYLWPEMRRAYREIRPRWIIGENVTGILSMEDKSGVWREVFPEVESRKIVRYREVDHYEAVYTRQAKMLVSSICEDLEADGYEVQPFAIPAAATGAPHRRERIWFIAHAKSHRNSGGLFSMEGENDQIWESKERRKNNCEFKHNGSEWHVANANGYRADRGTEDRDQQAKAEQERDGVDGETAGSCAQRPTSDALGVGSQRSKFKDRRKRKESDDEQFGRCGGERNWWRWPTQSPVCGGDDGLPSRLDGITFSKWRAESIKGYGNAVVPQVPLQFLRMINEIEDDTRSR